MIQEILIGIIFLGAIFYIGNMFRQNLKGKNSHCSGCGLAEEHNKNKHPFNATQKLTEIKNQTSK